MGSRPLSVFTSDRACWSWLISFSRSSSAFLRHTISSLSVSFCPSTYNRSGAGLSLSAMLSYPHALCPSRGGILSHSRIFYKRLHKFSVRNCTPSIRRMSRQSAAKRCRALACSLKHLHHDLIMHVAGCKNRGILSLSNILKAFSPLIRAEFIDNQIFQTHCNDALHLPISFLLEYYGFVPKDLLTMTFP